VLHEFLTANRPNLIASCRAKALARSLSPDRAIPERHGVPIFLAQIIRTLEVEQTTPQFSQAISGSSLGESATSEIGITAGQHGRELADRDYTVEHVVRGYGDLCQAITDLACRQGARIEAAEFRTLNRCLDNATADAVNEFSFQRRAASESQTAQEIGAQVEAISSELRSNIHAASLAIAALQTHSFGFHTSPARALEERLTAMKVLVDRSLGELRLSVRGPAAFRLLSLADFMASIELYAKAESALRPCTLTFAPVERELAILIDSEKMFAALQELLQKAVEYARQGGELRVIAYGTGHRIRIDLHDLCGGAAAVCAGHRDGLNACSQSIATGGGILDVRAVEGVGCVVSIELPRHRLP
jgi:signal transduction histidine kinase